MNGIQETQIVLLLIQIFLIVPAEFGVGLGLIIKVFKFLL